MNQTPRRKKAGLRQKSFFYDQFTPCLKERSALIRSLRSSDRKSIYAAGAAFAILTLLGDASLGFCGKFGEEKKSKGGYSLLVDEKATPSKVHLYSGFSDSNSSLVPLESRQRNLSEPYVLIRIAAAELLFRKNHGLQVPSFRQVAWELFEHIATQPEAAALDDRFFTFFHSPQVLANFIALSPAVTRLKALLPEDQLLYEEAGELLTSSRSSAFGSQRSTPTSCFSFAFFRGNPHDRKAKLRVGAEFHAEEFAYALSLLPKEVRLGKLESLSASLPPLSHPEVYRILWALPKKDQWKGHLLLYPLLYTRLDHFEIDLGLQWAKRIDLEVINEHLRKANYPSFQLTSEQMLRWATIAANETEGPAQSEKSLLPLRDALRTFTKNDAWTASDLLHMQVSPRIAFFFTGLTHTSSLEGAARQTLRELARQLDDQAIYDDIRSNPDKQKMKPPVDRGISAEEISKLVEHHLDLLAPSELAEFNDTEEESTHPDAHPTSSSNAPQRLYPLLNLGTMSSEGVPPPLPQPLAPSAPPAEFPVQAKSPFLPSQTPPVTTLSTPHEEDQNTDSLYPPAYFPSVPTAALASDSANPFLSEVQPPMDKYDSQPKKALAAEAQFF